MSKAVAVSLAALALAGCGRYADFKLPDPPAGPEIRFQWSVSTDPVLGRGAAGQWDAVDVLNPSIVHWNGAYLNLYSGFDGKTWRTGAAVSPDGLQWTRRDMVLAPDPKTWEGDYIAANGSAAVLDGQLWYWYEAGTRLRIGLATSRDGQTWEKHATPVLDTGPRGSWDETGVADPYVIRAGNHWYMFYLGADRARRQRLGVARSADGVHWTKLRTNPILELGDSGAFDEVGLGEPAVWASNGYYWMLYTGRDRSEIRRIGMARSRDGVRWERTDAAPALEGGQGWNSKVVADPTVELTGSGDVRVWFGGGDVARPDERIHGQIGHAELRVVR